MLDLNSLEESKKKFLESCVTYCEAIIKCDKRSIKTYTESVEIYKKLLKINPINKFFKDTLKTHKKFIINYNNSLKKQKANLAKWQAEYDHQCWKMAALNFNGKFKVIRGGICENA